MKVGILGAGFMGGMHAACWSNLEDAELVMIADIRRDRAEKLAARYGALASTSAEEVLKRADIDVVDICLPTYLHREFVVKAARSGKHILCEKPIAITLEDADHMLEAVHQAGVKFMVAHVLRFWPEYLKLKEIYEAKELGNLLSLLLERVGPFPSWSEWMGDPQKSGGAILDLHIHDVDFLRFLLGDPKWTFAQGSLERVTAVYGYAGVEEVVASGGFVTAPSFPFRMAFRAVFEKGVVEFDSTRPRTFLIYRNGEEVPEQWEFKPPFELKGDFGGNIDVVWPYFSEISYFAKCIREDREPELASGESAKRSLALIWAERRSLETGKMVPF